MRDLILRTDFEGNEDILSYEDMKKDLIFQVKEDIETTETYKEYLLEDVKSSLNFDEYCKKVLEMKLKDINNGYSISILGDTYQKNIYN